MQQRRSSAAAASYAAAEGEANRSAGQVVAGQAPNVQLAAPAGIQCQPTTEAEIVKKLETIDRSLQRIQVAAQYGITHDWTTAKDLMRQRSQLLLRLHKIRNPRRDVAFTDEEADRIVVDRVESVRKQFESYEAELGAGRYPEGLLVFPFRPARGIFRIDVATINARRAGDTITVTQPLNATLDNPRFQAEVATLPSEIVEGIKLPANQIVGVKLYDEGGNVVLVRAADLPKFTSAGRRAVGLSIALTAADVLAGPAIGRGASFVSRKVLQPAVTAAVIGTAEVAPTALGGIASRTGAAVAERQVTGGVVRRAAQQAAERQVAGTAARPAAQAVVPRLGARPLPGAAATGAGVSVPEAVGRTVDVTPGGLAVELTPKQEARLRRVAEALQDDTKWGEVSARDRLRLGHVYDRLVEQLASAGVERAGGSVLHYAELTAELVAALRQTGGRVLITEGRIGIAGSSRLKRFDLLEIDFARGSAELIDLTATASARHRAKTRAYKGALEDLLGMPVEAKELIYTGPKGELLETLVEIPVR